MRFFQIIASGAALIASALAQSSVVQINSYPQTGVIAGQSYTVTYSPADDVATTFILRKGPSGDLGTIGTLTATATGGSFTWKVASSLVSDTDYALEIRRGDEVNYSAQFSLSGGSGVASSSAVSSVHSSASSSAASSKASSASSVASSSQGSSASTTVITSYSSMMTGTASVSGVISSTSSGNSTVSTSKPTGTSSSSLPESTGAAASLASSPLALVFGAVAAMMFLN